MKCQKELLQFDILLGKEVINLDLAHFLRPGYWHD